MAEKDFNLFQGPRFTEAMRSSGYKDTSYAVAELVDNAIDAGAKHVEIICKETWNHATGRHSMEQIAVLDDGHGMDGHELRSAFLFGDGTRGDRQTDIGKYGVGLPNSSLSQCKRLEVYSWQNSSKPLYSCIDVDAINSGERVVPPPEPKEIPAVWKKAAKHALGKSGTLVVWSKLDRCSWTTSKKIMQHSEFLIGRIYRKFLHEGNPTITMTTLRVNDDQITEHDSKPMLPNDPMYLMAPSSTPGKWGKQAMFKPDSTHEEKYQIEYDGREHTVTVRYSIEKDKLRDPKNVKGDQGTTTHGKHARKNTGVSIMRANREITLDTNLIAGSDPRERWWGVEIDIPTSLDLAVGLTSNKQQANTLSAIMSTINQFGEDDSDQSEMDTELTEQDRTKKDLFDMVREISSHIRSMQRRIRATRAGTRSEGGKSEAEKKIEQGIQQEIKKGKKTESDQDRESMKKEQRIETFAEVLISEGLEKETAEQRAKDLINKDVKVYFEHAELEGSNFFSVQNVGGILRVRINTNHRASKNLLMLTEHEEYKDLNDTQRLNLTKDGLWLLLASWARFEDLIENNERRKNIQDIRFDWGKELNTFLEQNES